MNNYSKAPKYARTNESTTGRHGVINPGPEHSKFDMARHEAMNLKYPKGTHVSTRENSIPVCSYCNGSIILSDNICVNGESFHGSCFIDARHQNPS